MKINIISVETKKRCIELSRQGKIPKEIYTEYYSHLHTSSYDTFRKSLAKWKRKVFADDELLETGNLSYAFYPHATTVQVGKDGQITQTWIKSKGTDGLYLELIENIKNLPPFEPIEKRDVKPVDKMLEITFDDLHFGIATLDDYADTLQDTITIINSEQYKEINIVIGEDLLHADNFRGKTSNETYVGEIDIPTAYNDALTFYSNIIIEALACSDRVRVFYSMGNHSEALSWTIVQVLKVKFPQVEYDDSLEHRKVILFEKIFIGVTHGDTLNKKSLRDIKELFMEENLQAYANATVKEIHVGHLHTLKETGDVNGCIVRRLSTKVPTDKWHNKNGFTMGVKRFMLFEYSEDKLLSIHYV